jgi:hypothetical protein
VDKQKTPALDPRREGGYAETEEVLKKLLGTKNPIAKVKQL